MLSASFDDYEEISFLISDDSLKFNFQFDDAFEPITTTPQATTASSSNTTNNIITPTTITNTNDDFDYDVIAPTYERWLRLGEDVPAHSWTRRLDNAFPDHKQFQVSIGTGMKLMGLGYRMWKYVKRETSAGRIPIMDPFNSPKIGPIMGVPIGGIGSGSINRGWKGDFVRWNLKHGIVRSETIDADKFSVYIRFDDKNDPYAAAPTTKRAVVLCPGKPKSNFNLDVWNWGLKGDRSQYFGLFPRAWTVYEEPHPDIRLVCKQISPVIPHNYQESSYPCGVFVWRIENNGSSDADVSLMLTFQNSDGSAENDVVGGHHNKSFKYVDAKGNKVNGVTMHNKREIKACGGDGKNKSNKVFNDPLEVSIAVRDDDDVQFSYMSRFDTTNRLEAANLWYSFNKAGVLDNVDDTRPSGPKKAIASAIAAKVTVPAGSVKEIVFSIAWDNPITRFNSGYGYYRRYTKFYGISGTNSQKIAAEAIGNYRRWDDAIVAWQQPILDEPTLPSFYKQALFNELYYFVDGGSVWTAGKPADQPTNISISSKFGDDGPDSIGKFAYLESQEYLMYNTYDVHFYASFALASLWPRLETSLQCDIADATLLDYGEMVECVHTGKQMPRKARGTVPHDLGNPGEDPWRRVNSYNIMDISRWKDLPSKFVLQVYRDYLVTQDKGFLLQLWGVVEEVIRHAFEFDTDNDGVVDNEGVPDQTYDTWSALGCSAYSGGLWLASLRVASEMAKVLGLKEDEIVYNKIFDKGRKSYVKKLWNGHYFNYDSSKNPHFDSIMADQLAGHCIINEYNVKSFANGNEVWIGTSYSLAATMFLHFMDKEGWSLVEGLVDSTYHRWGFQYQKHGIKMDVIEQVHICDHLQFGEYNGHWIISEQ
eukprot:gene7372-8591_t